MVGKILIILSLFFSLTINAQELLNPPADTAYQDPLVQRQTDSLAILRKEAASYDEYFNRMVRVSPNSTSKNFPVIINGKTVTISNSIEACDKYSPESIPVFKKALANMITGGVMYGCGLILLALPIRTVDSDNYFTNPSVYFSLGLDIGGLIFMIRGTKLYGRGLRMYDADLKKRYGITIGKKIDLDDF